MIFRKSDVILIFILIISALYCYAFFGGYLGLSDGNDYAGLARNILRGEGFSLGHLYPLALTFNSDIPQPNNLWAPVYPDERFCYIGGNNLFDLAVNTGRLLFGKKINRR